MLITLIVGGMYAGPFTQPPFKATATYAPTHPSASARQPLKRQVFISHTGQDEHAKDFAASVVKPALEAAGLAVYMDYANLELGDNWSKELVDAAANSMVVVAVLSKSYAERFWCMLELDLALHAHPQQLEGEEQINSRSRPLVIPVFFDAVIAIVDVAAIETRWSSDLKKVWQEEELDPAEWASRVDAGRWAANIAAMKGGLQHMRKPEMDSSKDTAWQLARKVVARAVKHIPSLVDVGATVVGFEEQEAALAAELGGRLGLWLYGPGASCVRLLVLYSNMTRPSDARDRCSVETFSACDLHAIIT